MLGLFEGWALFADKLGISGSYDTFSLQYLTVYSRNVQQLRLHAKSYPALMLAHPIS